MRPGDSESRDAMRAKLAEWVERLRMRPLSELPNTGGFRFVGIRHDGSRVECKRTTFDLNWHETGPDTACSVWHHELAGWEPVEAVPSFRDEMDARQV